MAQKTKEQLKSTLVYGHILTGEDCTDLVDSLKGLQTPVSSPAASGNSTAFIDTISQDAEGNITATKKNVNFSGYQTLVGMANYQRNDVQRIGNVNVTGTGTDVRTEVEHNKGHYPTVRLIDASGSEIRPKADLEAPYSVQHIDVNNVLITLSGSLNVGGLTFKYILD